MNVDVVVIGGGIAGLATAYELQRRQLSFVVLDQARRAGGVILSEQIEGYTVDAGPDALLVQKPDGVRLCEEIGLGHRLVPTKPPRIAYIQRGGRLHPLPAGSVLGIPTRVAPFVGTRLFSLAGKLRMGMELLVPARRDEEDESIGAFMTRRFGREATEYLAEPLLAGIHAGDVDRLSLRALFPRFVEAERRYGSLLRAFRTNTSPALPDGPFRTLPGGLSELVAALVAALPPGSVRVGCKVERIAATPGAAGFSVETASGTTFHGRAIVLSTPAYVTASLVREIDAELARLCDQIRYASTATVVLAFARSDVTHSLNGSGFVVPRVESTGLLAASWLSSKWPHRAPDADVLMRTFVGGARDPHALERSDAELVGLSIAALTPLIGITGRSKFSRVYRWERASAQHEVGHLARVAAIDARLATIPGVWITGSGFRGVGIPDCIADGRATAAKLATAISLGDASSSRG